MTIKTTLRFFLGFSMLIGALQVNAQSVKDYIRHADEAYNNGEYAKAATFYNKVLDESIGGEVAYPYNSTNSLVSPTNFPEYTYVAYRLGESYRLYFDHVKAEKWYATVVKLDSTPEKHFPLARYWYAHTLKANKNYSKALAEYQLFKYQNAGNKEYQALADEGIRSSKYCIEAFKKIRKIELKKLESSSINSNNASSFASVLTSIDDSIIFSSSKGKDKDKALTSKLYASARADGKWTNPELLNLPSNGDGINTGAASITTDGKTIYFTKWDNAGSATNAAIYVSNYTENGWSIPTKLSDNVNVPGYNTTHPFIAANGRMLYYASDRPEGYGKFDIYWCSIDAVGEPGIPHNLGTTINTPDDDETPFYDEANKSLYFSSRGREGMGGLDIYKAKGAYDKWSKPVNMGYPINSTEDDAYLVLKAGGKAGFLSSDRAVGCCYELYEFNNICYTAVGVVLNKVTRQPIDSALVILVDSSSNNKEIARTYTNKNGQYIFYCVDWDKRLKIETKKPKFFNGNETFNTIGKKVADTIHVNEIEMKPMVQGKAYLIPNIYYDFDKATLRPESKIAMDTSVVKIFNENPDLIIEIGSHTDSFGSDEYNMRLSNARAKSVVDYLLSKGIGRKQLTSRGYGESMPVVPNANSDGTDNEFNRQLNRRTEFKVRRVDIE